MGALDKVNGMSVFDPTCISRAVLEHAVSKWGSLTLVALTDGALRFSEVRRALIDVSDRMLSQTLRQLEQDGLVSRTVRSSIPPHVEYELTGVGRPIAARLGDLIDAIYDQVPAIVLQQTESTRLAAE